jgi:hypothetical protein
MDCFESFASKFDHRVGAQPNVLVVILALLILLGLGAYAVFAFWRT